MAVNDTPSYVTYGSTGKDGTTNKIPADAFKRRMMKQRKVKQQGDILASSMSSSPSTGLSSMRKYGYP